MGANIITTITDVLTSMITGLGGALKTAVSTLIWQDPAATTKSLSDLAVFVLTFLGIGIATSAVYFIFRLIKKS